jgi:hypothetical protein
MNVTTAQLRKVWTAIPTYVVFGAAAYQSFGHAIHLADKHGAADPWLLPISIDGLMVVASRYVSHGRTKAARLLAGGVVVFAMLAMLTINFLAAPAGDPIGQALSVLPALGMIATAALIHWAPQKPAKAVRKPAARRPRNVTPITKAKAATAR